MTSRTDEPMQVDGDDGNDAQEESDDDDYIPTYLAFKKYQAIYTRDQTDPILRRTGPGLPVYEHFVAWVNYEAKYLWKLKGQRLTTLFLLPNKISNWTVKQVLTFFNTLGLPYSAAKFKYHKIDGAALLMLRRADLNQGDLMMSIGAATKIHAIIERLRSNFMTHIPEKPEDIARMKNILMTEGGQHRGIEQVAVAATLRHHALQEITGRCPFDRVQYATDDPDVSEIEYCPLPHLVRRIPKPHYNAPLPLTRAVAKMKIKSEDEEAAGPGPSSRPGPSGVVAAGPSGKSPAAAAAAGSASVSAKSSKAPAAATAKVAPSMQTFAPCGHPAAKVIRLPTAKFNRVTLPTGEVVLQPELVNSNNQGGQPTYPIRICATCPLPPEALIAVNTDCQFDANAQPFIRAAVQAGPSSASASVSSQAVAPAVSAAASLGAPAAVSAAAPIAPRAPVAAAASAAPIAPRAPAVAAAPVAPVVQNPPAPAPAPQQPNNPPISSASAAAPPRPAAAVVAPPPPPPRRPTPPPSPDSTTPDINLPAARWEGFTAERGRRGGYGAGYRSMRSRIVAADDLNPDGSLP